MHTPSINGIPVLKAKESWEETNLNNESIRSKVLSKKLKASFGLFNRMFTACLRLMQQYKYKNIELTIHQQLKKTKASWTGEVDIIIATV